MERLTEEQIIKFIEQYGDGDIYFSHYHETDGKTSVKYLPKFTKFADWDNIEPFKEELTEHPHLKDKYLQEIILTPNYAYIPNGDNKNPLVKNYKKFLEDLSEAKKIAQKKQLNASQSLKYEHLEEQYYHKRNNQDKHSKHGHHRRER